MFDQFPHEFPSLPANAGPARLEIHGRHGADQGIRGRPVHLLDRALDAQQQLLNGWIGHLRPGGFQLQQHSGEQAGQILATAPRLQIDRGPRVVDHVVDGRRRLAFRHVVITQTRLPIGEVVPDPCFADQPRPQHEAGQFATFVECPAQRRVPPGTGVGRSRSVPRDP